MMTKLIAEAVKKDLQGVQLVSLGRIADDGYATARSGFRLVEAASKKPVFPDLVFAEFISCSANQRFALLIKDQGAREAYYDLTLLDLKTGKLFYVHRMGRGEKTLSAVSWKSTHEVEYRAFVMNEEVRPAVSGLPAVSESTLRLEIPQEDAAKLRLHIGEE